jgi:desulfoferrodoxin-like iron-binding protein
MSNQTGKRYVCKVCGSEMLVTKGGNGTLQCCGEPMQIRTSAAVATPPT